MSKLLGALSYVQSQDSRSRSVADRQAFSFETGHFWPV